MPNMTNTTQNGTHRSATIATPSGGEPISVGQGHPLTIVAGPCTFESLELGREIAATLKAVCEELGVNFVFKASFDKANRSSVDSPRGPQLATAMEWFGRIREEFQVPVTTDIHEPGQAGNVAPVVDVLQIPAFLCRQTDLLVAASEAAVEHVCAINIKKGQFLSPVEMRGPIHKCQQAGCDNLIVTERGTFFGYHRLVTDVIGLADLVHLDPDNPEEIHHEAPPANAVPVCFDATHSAQLPGATKTTGGRRERVTDLARAAAALRVHALFIECHPDPENAMSDAATMLHLDSVRPLLKQVVAIHDAVSRD